MSQPEIEMKVDFDGTKYWYLNNEEVTWKEVFRQANGDLEKECRILTYALTNR